MTYRFIVETTHQANELVSDLLFEAGAMGVTVNDPNDFNEIDKNGAVWDYLDDSDKQGAVTVEGFFDLSSSESLFASLTESLHTLKKLSPFDVGSLRLSAEVVPETDWMAEWKKYYKPILLDKIAIYPAWIQPQTDLPVVQIDPGAAFGTGEHESTRMCLQLLTELSLKGKEIADVGCGSGILGMAALRLGAKNVYFSDIDQAAIDNLQNNISLNGFTENTFQVRTASLLDGFNGVADIICANITADILLRLLPQVPTRLNKKGVLLLSGVIAMREEEVLSAYQKAGFRLVKRLEDKEWRAYAFTL